MSKTIKVGQAGTMESNDIMIMIVPGEPNTGVKIELTSPVLKQYGAQIRKSIMGTVKKFNLQDVIIQANDKGALDCTIEARVETAIRRAINEEVAI